MRTNPQAGDLTSLAYRGINRYHLSYLNRAGSINISSATAERLSALPFIVPRTQIFDRIGLYFNAAAGAGVTHRLGVYKTTGVLPGALKLDAGTVPADVAPSVQEIIIDLQLSAGLYWLAILQSNTVANNFKAYASSDNIKGLLGTASLDTLAATEIYASNVAYGALPDPFPESITFVYSNAPVLGLRRSA